MRVLLPQILLCEVGLLAKPSRQDAATLEKGHCGTKRFVGRSRASMLLINE